MDKLGMVTQERLKELFKYNPASGKFTRLIPRGSCSISSPVGTEHGDGYLQVRIDGARFRCHRLAWLYTYGEFPLGQIDHINGDTADNRLENLRVVSHAENMRNRATQKDNSSGHIGVGFNKTSKKWIARIGVNGCLVYLGCFDDLKDAIKIRKAAEKEYGYHKNHGRISNIKGNSK